jgi:hypothetical protein
MEVMGYIFGLTGVTWGIIAFAYATQGQAKIKSLEERIQKLEKNEKNS